MNQCMNRHKNHVDLLLHVANRLGELKDDAVFIGGSICGLLLTDPASGDVRPTDDVDFVVQVTTKSQYDNLQEQLRKKGFRDVVDEVGPICRMKIDSIFVDVIPEKNILGFHNEWLRRAIETSETHVLESGNISNEIRVINASLFLCTKIVAFKDRGNNDYRGSHDIEDIIAILNGRVELWRECWLMPEDVRGFLKNSFRELLEEDDFLDAMPGMLAHGSTGRDKIIRRRMQAIADLLLEKTFSGHIEFDFDSNSNQKIEVAIISGNDFEEEIIFPTITVTVEGALNLLSELGITDYAAPWARKARRLFDLENFDTAALARWNLLPPMTVY